MGDPAATEAWLASLGMVPALCGMFGLVAAIGLALSYLRRGGGSL